MIMMTHPDDVLFEGMMFKKGRRKEWFSIIKPWAERTIKLIRSGKVQYFDNDKLRGEVNVKGAHVVERSPEEAEGRFFAFEIVSADEKEASLLLSAKTRVEMNSWIKCVLLVATNAWENAKDAESTSSARAMPFPVRIRAPDLADRSSMWCLANQSVLGRLSSTGLNSEEEDALVKQCEKHSCLWKETLSSQERAVLLSLRMQLDANEQMQAEAAGNMQEAGGKHKPLRHKESESNLWVKRLGQKAASKERSIKQYLGFAGASMHEGFEKEERVSSCDSSAGDSQASSSPERSSSMREGQGEVSPVVSVRRGSLAGVKANLAINKVAVNEVKNRDEEGVLYEPWVVLTTADGIPATPKPITWVTQSRPRVFTAIEEGNEAYIQQLCNGGKADVAALNARLAELEYGVTVLHTVMSYGRPDIMRLFLSQPQTSRPRLRSVIADTTAMEQSHSSKLVGWMVGESILHAACTRFVDQESEEGQRRQQGQVECLQLAIDHMQTEDAEDSSNATHDINQPTKLSRWTPLHKAAWFGLVGHVKLLLSYRKTDTNVKEGKEGAAAKEDNCEGKAVEAGDGWESEEDDALLNVDKRDASGFTALHLAAAAGHLLCVQALLEGGANMMLSGGPGYGELDATTKSTNFFTVAHLAAYGGHAHVLEYLFSLDPAKLSFKLRSVYDKAALQTLFCKRHCRGGCERGVDYFAVLSGAVEAVQVCQDHGFLSCATAEGSNAVSDALCAGAGTSPLHAAAFKANEDIVSFLLRNDANVSKLSNMHRTPLHEACRGGNPKVIDALVSAGASFNDKDFWGNTVMHLAAGANKLSAVKCLVERYSVDISHRNTEGATALDVALARDHGEVVRYLKNHVEAAPADGDVIPVQDQTRRSSYHVLHPQAQSNSSVEENAAAAAAALASSSLPPPPAAADPSATSSLAVAGPSSSPSSSRFGGTTGADSAPPPAPVLTLSKPADIPAAEAAPAAANVSTSAAASLFGALPSADDTTSEAKSTGDDAAGAS